MACYRDVEVEHTIQPDSAFYDLDELTDADAKRDEDEDFEDAVIEDAEDSLDADYAEETEISEAEADYADIADSDSDIEE